MNKMMGFSLRGCVASALTLAAVLLFSPSAEAKMTYTLNDTVRTGFNALDHVLQRPLGNPVFGHKSFCDHFFVSGGAGVSMTGAHTRPGARLELMMGDWVTPVHGWRIGLSGGMLSRNKGFLNTYFGGISVDYLLNFSALLRGDNPRRPFELIGGVGMEYQRTKSNGGGWGNEVGVRASLQGRFNVGRSMYIYMEPRLTLYAGTRYPGEADNFRRFRPELGFNLGLGYRLLRGAERMDGATDFINVDENHLFFGAGGGVASFIQNVGKESIVASGQFYVGKWLSSVAGLRLNAQFGRYGVLENMRQHNIAFGGLDYVWNISSAFAGYRPADVFGLNLNLGVAAAYVDNAKGKVYPGVEGGLTATFRLSPNWSLYIEPQVQVFTRSFSEAAGKGRTVSPTGSLMAGLRYTIGNFAHDFPESYEEYARSKHYFLMFGGAPSVRLRGDYGTGFAATVGFGKLFTPISSWRITANAEMFSQSPKFASMSVSADYLCSISTTMAGFNPNRVFDLSGVLGVSGGASHYDGHSVKPLLEAKVGLHGAFRLSDCMDLYIEPQAVASYSNGVSSTRLTPGIRVMAGLTYRLGRGPVFSSTAMGDSPLEGLRNFVSVSGGPTLFSGNVAYKYVNGAFDASVGRWFTLVSGLRAGVTYDFVPARDWRKRVDMSIIHADYMLNITSLMTRDAERRFHIIGTMGAGIGFSGSDYSKAGLAVGAGVQFRYNLPNNIDVHIEPNASFIMNRVVPEYAGSSRFMVMGRIMAGASYRF